MYFSPTLLVLVDFVMIGVAVLKNGEKHCGCKFFTTDF